MKLLGKLAITAVAIVVFYFAMEGLVKISCYDKKVGTMVVIGGNSHTCR